MRTTSLFLALTLTFAACGGPTDPAALNDLGAAALGSGNFVEAATQFDAALTGIGADTSNDQYLRAKWGLIEAGAHVSPDRAAKDFLQLAKANSATMSAKEFAKVGSWLSDAKAFTEATQVVAAGVEAYSETPALISQLQDIKKKAEQAGDTDAMDALGGLGYLGDD